jgi:hypothetical protein
MKVQTKASIFISLCILGVGFYCIGGALVDVRDAKADERSYIRIIWSAGMPTPSEVSRICPDGPGSSSLNFVRKCAADNKCWYDVELLPGCRIEYSTAQGKMTLLPAK